MNKKGLIGAISLGAVLIFALIMVVICMVKVPAGYVGVVYSMNGGVQDQVLSQGYHLIAPGKKVTTYTVGLEQSYITAGDQGDSDRDESFTASSSEGKAITIDMTFTYQFDPERVNDIFTKFKGQPGKAVRDSFIKPNIISWTKEIVAGYKVSDIIGSKRADINAALTEYLSNKFESYGIIITNVSLINLEVDEETRAAINEKITAQQKQETQTIENQTAIDKAEADAQVKRTQAQAEADAMLIEAEATAKSNKMISDSLTTELIESQKIEKWSGDVPVVQGSGASIIDVGNVINNEE